MFGLCSRAMRHLQLPLLFLLALSCATAPHFTEAFDPAKLEQADAAIERAIADRIIPGGVLWVERNGAVYGRAFGNRALVPEVERITPDTIYDAASLTKVVATAPSIWRLVERGKIDIDAPVKTYIPEFAGGWRDEVTVRHLLTHTSGLRAGLSLKEPWRGYDEGIRRAVAEEPRNRPGAIFLYSDINYILLGDIVRRVSGEPLDVFAKKNIFEPLGMRDTTFRPRRSERIAPTERVEGVVLRGDVHDPTSSRMGGVAGHAGMFTTAEDLARFARAVVEGKFPAAMTIVQSPPAVAVRRAGGFDIDSSYSWPRGEFPLGSFGHTGYTGGSMWIDPSSGTFVIFLSNRVHPDDRGSLSSLRRTLSTLAAKEPANETPRVRWVLGGGNAQNAIDALAATQYEPLRGLRVGLITNHTGIDRQGNPTIDLLRSAPNVSLIALFSPEHGIRGVADARVADDRDAVTGLPIYSLYGERRKPSAEQLANLDALVFDIQDIGARFYTYISTLGMAMEAAAESKKKFFVLDRVNPIGATIVEGPVLEGPTDFVGYHTIPIRHGMTVGELAKMFRDEKKLDVELTVIAVRNWKREQWQDEAGLPWINTSPNMRSITAAGLYPGIGLMESAISVGRGTPTPFEVLGAPYIDGTRLAAELDALQLPGIRFEPVRFTPDASIHKGEPCGGVRMTITDRRTLRAVDVGIAIATILERLYPAQFDENKMTRLLRHPATLDAIRAGKPLAEIRQLWPSDFGERRAKYLLY
jgi:uncharacterized protein YbbC (DUF1343 family)/CubicO group peptidase (beta-lactamase class C family)